MTRGTNMTATGLVGLMGLTMPAVAGDFGFSFSFGDHGRAVGVGVNVGRPVVPAVAAVPVVAPVPVAVPVERVWIPPTYKMITERVWVPTIETAYRDVPVTDWWGRVVSYRREAYAVNSGHWEDVQRQVLVNDGYWSTAAADSCRVYPTATVPAISNNVVVTPGERFNGNEHRYDGSYNHSRFDDNNHGFRENNNGRGHDDDFRRADRGNKNTNFRPINVKR